MTISSVIRSAGCGLFAAIMSACLAASAGAQPKPPAQPAGKPTVEQALGQAYMTFCMPLVVTGATNTAEIAKRSGYQPTALPDFKGFTVRTAPAWLAPSASGRVVVTRGATSSPNGCEIIVTGSAKAPLEKELTEMLTCKGCPFVKNAKMSGEQSGLRYTKYDWKLPKTNALVSVLTVVFPDGSPTTLFLDMYRVGGP